MVSINIRCICTYQSNPVLTTHHVQVSWQERCAKILRRSYGGSHTISVPLMRVQRVSHKFSSSKRQTSDTRRFRTDTGRGNTRALEKRGIESLERRWNRSRSGSRVFSFQKWSTWFIKVDRGECKPPGSQSFFSATSTSLDRNFKEDARDFKKSLCRIPLMSMMRFSWFLFLLFAAVRVTAYDSSQATRPATR